MYAKPACVLLALSLIHVGGPFVLLGVELATMNNEHFTSSAARLGYQRLSGVSTVYGYGCKHWKDSLESIKKRWGISSVLGFY